MHAHLISSKSPVLLLAAVTTIVLSLTLTASDNSKDREECAESLTGLATCLPYVQGTAKAPTPDCCAGLKQLIKTNKKCLCVVIRDRNDPQLGLTINITLALGLPGVCHVTPANISECPALLGLPPNSPEAQIFYQLAKNSTDINPAAGGPAPSGNPTTAPTGATALGGAPQQKNGGGGNGRAETPFHFAAVLFCSVLSIMVFNV